MSYLNWYTSLLFYRFGMLPQTVRRDFMTLRHGQLLGARPENTV